MDGAVPDADGLEFERVPFRHQLEALRWSRGRAHYCLNSEQGTGKTFVLIADLARRFFSGRLHAALVIAPNGVQRNWHSRELPQCAPKGFRYRSAVYGTSAKDRRQVDTVMQVEPGEFKILLMHYDALATKKGHEAAVAFCQTMQRLGLAIICDESQRVKSPSAIRTRALHSLRRYASMRVLSTGTPILNAPFDAFSQYTFLDPNLFGITSFVAFKSEYAELLPPNSPLMRKIAEGLRPGMPLPTVVAKDKAGQPKWRNLDKLAEILQQHSHRVLKRDCLDLPPKIYVEREFEMTPTQARVYQVARDELRLLLSSGEALPIAARIGAFTKLSQIVSGYFLAPGTARPLMLHNGKDNNPKVQVLKEEVETCIDNDENIIIFARFIEELKIVSAALTDMEVSHVMYHGSVSAEDRDKAIDDFQARRVRVFLAQCATGSTGLTLTAASTVIYFSNTWSYGDRSQNEDRAHRIGQTAERVRYVDILAADSIDRKVVDALKNKLDLAQILSGDREVVLAHMFETQGRTQ